MLTIRKFLRTLLGTATPIQILLACVLGSLVGFLPITGGGWVAAIMLAVALLVLNANVFLAGLVAATMKLVSIATAPIAFHLGVMLVDGPLQPIFRTLVNAPVTAWLGFDSYLAVGGLAIGLSVGIGLGLVTAAAIRRLRGRLAGLESTSDAFKALTSRRSIRFLTWVVFGGIPKGGFTELHTRSGLPVRISGVVLSLALIVAILFGGWMFADGVARNLVVDRLSKVNGATVDLADLRIDWSGRIELRELAVCDSDRLDRNILAASRLVADFDVSDILRRRISIDLVEATEVYNDIPRSSPGRLVESSATTSDEPADGDISGDADRSDSQLPIGNLDQYLKTSGQWRDRLQQASEVLGKFRDWVPPRDSDDGIDASSGDTAETRMSSRESAEAWLRRQVDLHGYAGVRATHLLEDHPTILIRSIVAGGVRRGTEDSRRYDVYLDSVSTAPRLVDAPPSLRIRQTNDDLALSVVLASIARKPADDRFEVTIRNLPTDEISMQLVDADPPPFSGGRLNAEIDGRMLLGPTIEIAAPIDVELLDSRIRIGGEEATIPRLKLRLDVGGELSDPAIAIDEETLAESLREAGQAVLAEKARSEAEKQLDDGIQRLEDEVGIEIPRDVKDGIGEALGSGLGELFGGGKKKP